MASSIVSVTRGEAAEFYRRQNRSAMPEAWFRDVRREGTPAAALPDPVSETVKTARVRALIELGERKRAAFAQRFIGRPVTMLVERVDAQGRGHGWTSEYVEAVAACAPDARRQLITFTVRSCADAVLRDG